MSAFQSSKFFPYTLTNLTLVAQEVMQHFKAQGYEVTGEETLGGTWDISVHKGGTFKAVFGLKLALKINIEPSGTGTLATASVGVWGEQVVPTLLTLFVYTPVVIPQIWGLVKQSKLDDEALACIEQSLARHARPTGAVQPGAVAPAAAGSGLGFCTQCGAQLPGTAKFCSQCGAAVAAGVAAAA